MDTLTNVFIGFGLAMDCAAVSLAGGANTISRQGMKETIKAALLAGSFFGFFQGAMMLLGGYGGEALKTFVSGIDHWVAFSLLAFVGGKMVYEAFQGTSEKKTDLLDMRILTILAIATSIDALVVGAGIAFANGSFMESAIIVGVTTAAISVASVLLGKRIGHLLDNKIEILGGVILLTIGTNILLTHLGVIG